MGNSRFTEHHRVGDQSWSNGVARLFNDKIVQAGGGGYRTEPKVTRTIPFLLYCLAIQCMMPCIADFEEA